MDMNSINNWFEEHPDAILVTDKVITPIEFSNLFIDKNRLMMELFDETALEEGLSCGILSAMPSHLILDKMEKEDVKIMANRGVRDVVVP